MRIKRALVIMLACMLLAGQSAYAQGSVEINEADNFEEVQRNEVENGMEENGESEDLKSKAEEIEEKSLEDQENISGQEMETSEENTEKLENKIVYIDMPVRMNVQCVDMPWSYTIESSDSSICEVQTLTAEQDNGVYHAYFTLVGKKEGKVDIKVCNGEGTEEANFQVTVKILPDNAIRFRDPMLIGHLLGNFRKENSCDENKDGYITKEELEKVKTFSLSIPNNSAFDAESIKDLSGMENAVNAIRIELFRNEMLQDLSAIRNLKKLEYVGLRDTNVSDEEKWEFADIKDVNIKRSEKVLIPRIEYLLEGIEVSEIQNDGVIVQNDARLSIYSTYQYYYSGIKSGKAVLEVSYKDFKKQIEITVTGKMDEYPVGTPMIDPTDVIWLADKGMCVLNASGELWTLESKFEKIASNIKKVSHTLNEDLILKTNGDLLIGCSGSNCIAQNVVDIVQHRSDDLCYVLKKDGTLWIYGEDVPLITGKEVKFQQIDTNVKGIALHGYLKNDGTVKSGIDEAKNVEYINDVGYYVKNEGFHFRGGTIPYANSIYDLKVKDITWDGGHYDEVEDISYDAVLTMEGEVWAFLENPDAAPVRLGGNAERLLDGASADWVDKDGNYYKYNRKLEVSEMSPMYLDSWRVNGAGGTDYDLALFGDEKGGYFLKNGAKMLDFVKEILYVTEDGRAFILRTDGTVWCMGDTLIMLGSIASDFKKGDVNEDGEVNIRDLQIVLRGVCEKIELTERQIMIADVVADGKVDIQDLRKELRFVCGKIEEL